jgi:hypothetical protein
MCDCECPNCGARHMSPYTSDDLTMVVEPREAAFVVLRSPDTAEHDPDYHEVARFSTRELAESYWETAAEDQA